jgi:hypothetical protein
MLRTIINVLVLVLAAVAGAFSPATAGEAIWGMVKILVLSSCLEINSNRFKATLRYDTMDSVLFDIPMS